MPASAAIALLDHYRRTARLLPWRAPPGAPRADPYRVWLSEVMLQQTTVAAVIPRFKRFLERWPTVEALAEAADKDVLHEWAGLGYYARARNLIACARAVAAAGGFPDDEAGLRALPGIGDYTAAAIAAIAFGRDCAAIDTNVERVVARLEATSDKAAIGAAARAVVPAGQAGDFAQAMMDLGATICRPRNPDCAACPISAHCEAFARGTPEAFPAKAARKVRPVRYGIAQWIEHNDSVWLVRRPDRGLLGGMPALPGPDWSTQPPALPASPATPVSHATPGSPKLPDSHLPYKEVRLPYKGAGLAEVRHGFTHFELRLSVTIGGLPNGDGWWQPIATLGEAGLPTLYRRAVETVLAQRKSFAA